jgi:hypothetical protein
MAAPIRREARDQPIRARRAFSGLFFSGTVQLSENDSELSRQCTVDAPEGSTFRLDDQVKSLRSIHLSKGIPKIVMNLPISQA